MKTIKMAKIATTLAVTTLLFSACINKPENPGEKSPEQESNQGKSQDESTSGSFADFLGMNKNQKCTWDGGEDGKSTLYTDGTRGKMEMIGQMGDENTTFYMVNDGEWVYTWNSDSDTGMKMSPDEMGADDEYMEEDDEMLEYLDGEGEQEYPEDDDFTNQEFDYNCEDWRVDGDMFIPPSDIEFTDLSLMMDNIKNELANPDGGTPDLSAFCDMLSGEDKDECYEGMMEVEGL